MKVLSHILHSPLLMSIIGVVLALSIMWSTAEATTFRVDLPVYPGAQQVKIFGDSDKQILTFVTQDTEAQVQEFYKGSFSSRGWYYGNMGSESQQVCCHQHAKAGTYLPGTERFTSITADYVVGIDFSSEQENTLVTVTANNYKDGFYRISFDYWP